MQATSSPDIAWPIVLPMLPQQPKSTIDFGCGTGHWLAALKRYVPVEVLGLNSPDRKDAGQHLSAHEFMPVDLTEVVDLGRKFDLAVCVEVAEHLPASAADTIINTICRHADTVLFAAAIPGQGGLDHYNEQWPSYWNERFEAKDFKCFDCIRPIVWGNQDISVWYRQNLMLFMRAPLVPKFHGDDWRGTPLVHPDFFIDSTRIKRRSLRNLARFALGRRLY